VPKEASQSRVAFISMVSNTGSKLPGELEMMRCSRASERTRAQQRERIRRVREPKAERSRVRAAILVLRYLRMLGH
jgi:hypothetical protein